MSNEAMENCCIIDAKCGIDSASPCISQYTDSFSQIKFLLGGNFDDYTIMIITNLNGYVHIIPEGGQELTKVSDENGNTELLWTIGREITASDGAVIYQIAAYKLTDGEPQKVWYSKEGRLFVSESIDSTTYSASLVGSNPNLITELILKLGSLDFLAKTMDKKLSGVEEGAEVNVQSDWLEEDESSDAYIKNKPTVDQQLDIFSDNAVANSVIASEISGLGAGLDNTKGDVANLISGATPAGKATMADCDAEGRSIFDTYATSEDLVNTNTAIDVTVEDLANHKLNADEKALHVDEGRYKAINVLFEALSSSAETTPNEITKGGFAVGYNNTVGATSLAVGTANEIIGTKALGVGLRLQSTEVNQIIGGQYNQKKYGALLILGYGSSDTDRANVFTVDRYGNVVAIGSATIKKNAFINGNLSVDGTIKSGGAVVATQSDIEDVAGDINEINSTLDIVNSLATEAHTRATSSLDEIAGLSQGTWAVEMAKRDADGNYIPDTYASKTELEETDLKINNKIDALESGVTELVFDNTNGKKSSSYLSSSDCKKPGIFKLVDKSDPAGDGNYVYETSYLISSHSDILTGCNQILVDSYGDGEIKFRSYDSTSGEFFAWQKFVGSSDLSALETRIANLEAKLG